MVTPKVFFCLPSQTINSKLHVYYSYIHTLYNIDKCIITGSLCVYLQQKGLVLLDLQRDYLQNQPFSVELEIYKISFLKIQTFLLLDIFVYTLVDGHTNTNGKQLQSGISSHFDLYVIG